MASDHWGLLGEPPSEVKVVVSARNPQPVIERITLRHRILIGLFALVPVAVAIALAIVIATGSGRGGISSGAPAGGAVRCINASTLCMTRGSVRRRS